MPVRVAVTHEQSKVVLLPAEPLSTASQSGALELPHVNEHETLSSWNLEGGNPVTTVGVEGNKHRYRPHNCAHSTIYAVDRVFCCCFFCIILLFVTSMCGPRVSRNKTGYEPTAAVMARAFSLSEPPTVPPARTIATCAADSPVPSLYHRGF